MLQHEVIVALLVYIVITIIFYVLGYQFFLFAVVIHFIKARESNQTKIYTFVLF